MILLARPKLAALAVRLAGRAASDADMCSHVKHLPEKGTRPSPGMHTAHNEVAASAPGTHIVSAACCSYARMKDGKLKDVRSNSGAAVAAYLVSRFKDVTF